MKPEDITKPLEVLEKINISDEYERRLAFKAIYDFLKRALFFFCTEYFGWREEVIKPQGLNSRWKYIETALNLSKVCTENELNNWSKFMKDINKTRNKVEHNDFYSPKQNKLEMYIQEYPLFIEWLNKVSKEYLKISSNFTFKMAFYSSLEMYIRQAEFMLEHFGESPYLVNVDWHLKEEYNKLNDLILSGKEILKRLKKTDLPERNDLVVLTDLIEIVSRVDVAESACLSKNMCPKCGEEIVNESRYIGGSLDDPEPYAVIYRVGCKNCDYTLDEELTYI
jgi:hypothetical protein